MFKKEGEGKVPLNNDVMIKCICPYCPVQAKSACSRPKIQKMVEAIASMKTSGRGMASGMAMSLAEAAGSEMKPKPEETPAAYCSIGVATCRDLDMNKACICPSCQVYKEFSLMQGRPVEHYCFNDKAV